MCRGSPPNPAPIYHITHVDNLAGIIANQRLFSDARRRAGACDPVRIGYKHIKDRRMNRPVLIAAGGCLGDYVPFNFCPRSVMLHAIWRGLVDGYEGGQKRVVHLVSSVQSAVTVGQPWAFTDRHAEPPEADYFENLDDLHRLRWEIIRANNWGGHERRPFKQAEFLVYDWFPWTAIEAIGVIEDTVAVEVSQILATFDCEHRPPVKIEPGWYY